MSLRAALGPGFCQIQDTPRAVRSAGIAGRRCDWSLPGPIYLQVWASAGALSGAPGFPAAWLHAEDTGSPVVALL